MQFPRINLNGTCGDVLLAEYVAANEAVLAALRAVQAITCHGRDYYVISSDAASTAYAEKVERLRMLVEINSDLEAHIEELDRQGAKVRS